MSTRATITVHDDRYPQDVFHIYRHHDGYPEGVLPDLEMALGYAWPLPRYESMDFAAAIIRAMKEPGGGSIYCTRDAARHADREWHYDVRSKEGLGHVQVDVYRVRHLEKVLERTVLLGGEQHGVVKE